MDKKPLLTVITETLNHTKKTVDVDHQHEFDEHLKAYEHHTNAHLILSEYADTIPPKLQVPGTKAAIKHHQKQASFHSKEADKHWKFLDK